MDLPTPFLSGEKTLQEFYGDILTTIRERSLLSEETFSSFTRELLMQPAKWYEALATFEYAIETNFDVPSTKSFFQKLFEGYDCNASIFLTDEDYAYYWETINRLFDEFAPRCSEALVEKGLQRYSPRREYADHAAVLDCFQKAIDQGSEKAKIVMGYYLQTGYCGVTDKEKGKELFESVVEPESKIWAEVYKGYILLQKGKAEEAHLLFEELNGKVTNPLLMLRLREQQAFHLDSIGEEEEAGKQYAEILKSSCLGASMMRLGVLNYNLSIEGASQTEGLRLMETAFCCGRYDAARSLLYCYYNSGQEWQDNERGMYWLHKGYDYYDPYSTYQLAYFHLFDDDHKDMEKGLFYLDKAIELDYPDAMCCKAGMHHRGELGEKNIDECVRLLQKALELGSGYAAYYMGLLYEEGAPDDGKSDYVKAFEYYEKAAEMGEIHGYELAGRYNLLGLGCEENLSKALEYYNKGLEYGSAYCMVELAFMYEDGNGVEADVVKSYELIKQAAEANYPYAYFLLGRCYRHGIGTNENPDEAIKYLQMAADAGVAKGETELALCYEDGYGVEANGKKALEYMMKAAEQEYTFAQYKVGCYYLYGLEGVEPDSDKSFEWMIKAAEAGYSYAQLEVGDYYLYDYNNKDESQKAYEYYKKAAEDDCINEGLGLCLEYGIGVEANEGEAFKYYMKAAEKEYCRAMYNVGRCYYYGMGIKQNLTEAFRWFSDAANAELASAMYYKGKMLLDGEGCSQNLEEGIALLKQASENNYADAQFLLGNCYLTGKGVPADDDMAMQLFEQAADNGHEQAMKVTGRRRK